MPLTSKGEEIKGAMEEQYGPEKGEQVFYASKNAGTITGVDTMADRPFGGSDPNDCADGIPPPMSDAMITPPALLPEPNLEHPQQYPDASAPPETSMGTQAAAERTLEQIVSDANGGITGGAMGQGWGEGWQGPTSDAMPAGCSVADILRDNEGFWMDQWGARPLGPDQK